MSRVFSYVVICRLKVYSTYTMTYVFDMLVLYLAEYVTPSMRPSGVRPRILAPLVNNSDFSSFILLHWEYVCGGRALGRLKNRSTDRYQKTVAFRIHGWRLEGTPTHYLTVIKPALIGSETAAKC